MVQKPLKKIKVQKKASKYVRNKGKNKVTKQINKAIVKNYEGKVTAKK